MKLLRITVALAAVASGMIACPASAQFFFTSPDMAGRPVRGDEPGVGTPLPDATDAEVRAALVWNMRAALNVAALQCQFEPTLLAVPNYNAILTNHKDELAKSFTTLTKYFTRTAAKKGGGQGTLDTFGTRVYAGFTTVAAQYGFCQTAGTIARDAVYVPRGQFYRLAEDRMREVRNSLVPWGEQRFPRYVASSYRASLPRLDAICWDKKNYWNDRKCGPFVLMPR